MRYIETKPLSQENQKIIDMVFQESTFMKIGPYSRSDQTKPSGILQKLHHHVRAYQKKFQLNSSIGGWENWSGSFKIWKTVILGFFEKGAPGPPQKWKKKFGGFFGHCGPQEVTKKNFGHFRDRVSKSVNMVIKRRQQYKV